MKRLLMICVLLVTMMVTAFAQKTIDYTTYDLIAKAGNVTVLVKDNDYRMVVGSLKKPKMNMQFGYSKEQATSRIDRIIDFSKDGYSRKDCNVSIGGVCFQLTITGEGENEKYHFDAVDKTVKFDLSAKDCLRFKKSIEDNSI